MLYTSVNDIERMLTMMLVKKLALFLHFGACLCQISKTLNARPIIGIYTAPTATESELVKYGYSYFPASYALFVQSAGAQVVPIAFDLPQPELKNIFESINGLLFIGGYGGIEDYINGFQPFLQNGEYLFKLAAERIANGEHFAIQGMCLGYEMILYYSTGNYSFIEDHRLEHVNVPLHLTPAASLSSVFESISPKFRKEIETENVTYNAHTYGVDPSSFASVPGLDMFKVLSTNKDENGQIFVSTIESKDGNIVATQWHPEKNAFEWDADWPYVHTPPAVQITQLMANNFIARARQSLRKFTSTKVENAATLMNFNPIDARSFYPWWQQIYVLPRSQK